MVPVFATIAFLANAMLVTFSWFYAALFIFQNAFYVLALLGYFLEKKGINKKIFYLPLYFCIVNFASLISMYKVLKKENIVTWQTNR
jgi:hypothetical protein